MNPVIVRNVTIGEGMPKICVPIIETNIEGIVGMAQEIIATPVDIIEWRLDWFEQVFEVDKVIEATEKLREIIPNVPILCTFRTSNEGGERAISEAGYIELYEALIATNLVDLIDVELYMGEKVVNTLIQSAHNKGVKVVLSNHDFEKTPNRETIVTRLKKMQELGSDISKIAVMPQKEEDVLTLMSATLEMKNNYPATPVITMSMAGIGGVSRVSGELTGSCVTFGTVSKASAPGQIEVHHLKNILQILHD